MNPSIPTAASHSLSAREGLAAFDMTQMWRVETGALRIDSAQRGEASRFMRLALPGDVIGVEKWVGTDDTLSVRALTPVTLSPVQASGPEMMHILMDTVVIAHQRCREVVSLRTGPVSQRVKCLLLMFADSVNQDAKTTSECALPNLSDMADILDAAPETVSRVFSSMRKLDYLQDCKPHRARFSSLALLIAVLGAIAPTLSHGLARAGDVPLVEICTSLGPRWVALTDSPDSPDGQKSALHIEHCPFCLHSPGHVLPPPSADFQGFGVLGEPVAPALGQAFLFITQPARVPPPRGPPTSLWLLNL